MLKRNVLYIEAPLERTHACNIETMNETELLLQKGTESDWVEPKLRTLFASS